MRTGSYAPDHHIVSTSLNSTSLDVKRNETKRKEKKRGGQPTKTEDIGHTINTKYCTMDRLKTNIKDKLTNS